MNHWTATEKPIHAIYLTTIGYHSTYLHFIAKNQTKSLTNWMTC